MTQNEFNVVLEQQYRKCADVLAHKKKEYTGDRIDRLSIVVQLSRHKFNLFIMNRYM